MLFSVTKECFLRLFKLASLVAIEKKAGVNVVGSHVLLTAASHKLTLTATDLDVELIVEEPFDSLTTPGSLVVPFRKISEICRAMTENVVLNVTSSPAPACKLNIESLQGFFSMSCLSPDVFPVLSHKIFDVEFSIEMKFLQELISKVAFAMGDDDGRHFLNGVFLHFSADEIVSVAADGHRLMVWQALNAENNKAIADLKVPVKILIPRKSVFDILKIMSDVALDLWAKISVGENHFRIVVNNITYTSKLLTATFPPFKKLIPQNTSKVLTVNREQLKSCLSRVLALLGDKSQGVKLGFSDNTLTITGKNEQNDLATENVPAVFDGPTVEICFNIKYLLDFLSNIQSDLVIFKVENATSGALIQDPALVGSYVLMPMQI